MTPTHAIRHVAAILAACTLGLAACSPPPAPPPSRLPMNWQPIDSLNARLPTGIRVFAGRNDSLPLRAWYVSLRESDPDIATHVVVSDDADRRETVSDFASDPAICVAANGGYFDMRAMPARHVGLLLTADSLVAGATDRVIRDSLEYLTARAAIGFTADDRIDIAWAVTRGDSVLAVADVPANRPESPAASRGDIRRWPVAQALGAGPALVMDGVRRITADEEVFFGTSIPETHPRTAAGYTAGGDLLLLVVDGRQDESRGVTLEELATLMEELGAVEALNLDGGGSSTLVVAGTRLNRPAGGDVEREVMSALVVTCGQTGEITDRRGA